MDWNSITIFYGLIITSFLDPVSNVHAENVTVIIDKVKFTVEFHKNLEYITLQVMGSNIKNTVQLSHLLSYIKFFVAITEYLHKLEFADFTLRFNYILNSKIQSILKIASCNKLSKRALLSCY